MNLAHEYKYGALVDLPVYDASDLDLGQSVIWGQDTSATGSYVALVDSAAVPIDVFGVLAENPSAQATHLGTPDIDLALVQLVNIVPVWRIYYDLAAANDIDATGDSSTTSLAHAAGDDNLDGAWAYINSGTGVGQLRYCKAATTTTKTPNTAFTTAPDATSDFILIRGQGRPTGGLDIDSTFTMLKTAVSATGQLMVLKNFVEGAIGPGELNVSAHGEYEADGLNSRGIRFFAHVIFMDTYFSVDSI